MINISPRVQEYKKRAKVSVSETGSELMIGAAGAEDGGEYNCSLTLGGATQAVVHTVVITGQLSPRQNILCVRLPLFCLGRISR